MQMKHQNKVYIYKKVKDIGDVKTSKERVVKNELKLI